MARSAKFLENFTKKPSNSNAKIIDQNLKLSDYATCLLIEWSEFSVTLRCLLAQTPEMSLAYRLVAYKKRV